MGKTVFDVLNERISESLTAAQDAMCGGSARDFAEYREACGYIRGLETALREVRDLARIQMEDDDD